MTAIGKARGGSLTRFLGIALATAALAAPVGVNALSDIKGLDGTKSVAQSGTGVPAQPEMTAPPANAAPTPDGRPAVPPADAKPVEVLRDFSALPAPVKALRDRLLEAAASGEIERLRPLLGTGADQTQLFVAEESDPIALLKSLSGDEEGDEILAILIDILSAGFVHVQKGTPEEAYVWPYFTEKSIASLTPPEKVELMRIVTAGDYQDMLEYGNYSFFRVGISPDGKWKFFTAGD